MRHIGTSWLDVACAVAIPASEAEGSECATATPALTAIRARAVIKLRNRCMIWSDPPVLSQGGSLLLTYWAGPALAVQRTPAAKPGRLVLRAERDRAHHPRRARSRQHMTESRAPIAPPGWRIFSRDGHEIGTVDAVFADYLLVRTWGLLPVDLYVPVTAVVASGG